MYSRLKRRRSSDNQIDELQLPMTITETLESDSDQSDSCDSSYDWESNINEQIRSKNPESTNYDASSINGSFSTVSNIENVSANSASIMMNVFHKHKLSRESQKDIIRMYNLFDQKMMKKPSTLYFFEKELDRGHSIGYEKLHYCCKCKKISEKDLDCTCHRSLQGTLYIFNLEQSIKHLISNNLEEVLVNQQDSVENLNCIRAGNVYKSQRHSPNCIKVSLILSIDDAPVYKSAKCDLTPIAFTIAELGDHSRKKRQNVYLSSIWISKTKPDIECYQFIWRKGFVDQFAKLSSTPVQFQNRDELQMLSIRVNCVVADQIARSLSLNHIQHNGYFGCIYCMIRGKRYANKTVYPFKPNERNLDKSYATFEADGIRGSTVLAEIISIPKQIPIGMDLQLCTKAIIICF